MAILPKAIYKFSAIPIKIPTQFFIEQERAILKFIWNNKKPNIVKTILSNKRNSGRISIPDLKQYSEQQCKKDSLFNKWCWFNWRSTCRRMQIDPFLSPCTKLNFKWIKNLNIRLDTLKLIEKKLGKTLEDTGTGENFLNRTPIAYALRSRIDKWDLIKLQRFCKAKDTIKRTNRDF